MLFTRLRTLAASLLVLLVLSIATQAYGQGRQADRSTAAPITKRYQIAELTGSDEQQYSFLGASVAVSGDTVVVGAPGITDFFAIVPGAVYVYVKPSTGWGNMTQVAKLTPSDTGGKYGFGYFVAIIGDTIVVNSNLPQVYVFEKPAGGWVDMTENAILSVSPIGLGPCLCGQMAVNDDTIAVGSPVDHLTNIGSIEVYAKPAGGWQSTATPSAVLIQPAVQDEQQSFASIAMSGGTIVGIGRVASATTTVDYVYLFLKPVTGWNGNYSPQATLSSTQAGNYFAGGTVAISGNKVVAGSNSPNLTYFPPSFVDVWVEPVGGWTDMTETAQLSDGNTTFADGFGTSTAIVGNRIIVGTPSAFQIKAGLNYRGAAYFFNKPVGGWRSTSTPSGILLNTDGSNNDSFGASVSGVSGTIAVGAPNGPNSSYNGRAYIY